MHPRTLALVIAATAFAAGCVSNEKKPEAETPAPVAAAPAPAAAPVAAKPECPPEATGKKKSTKATSKTKAAKKGEAANADCEPAKPKTASAPAKAAEPAPAPVAAPAAAPAKEAAKPAEAGKPRMMKSRDGTFEGEVYGNIPPNSKWAKLQIGMHQSEVERILGVTSNIRGYVTAKAWIPFYFGTDSHRYEAVYAGQGSVAYTGGGMGGGQGVLMMINYDPKIQ
ncbi:hypothetical protein [Quatrionicoccus australiensis]|uniref:hypothetical protein n=1 Tax=Quatrionicoccus australiensis TaxID=138118 RepID=UPI001CFAC083|nr:hypothetical protein [Quatrionicoccus australiensis]MCB4360644.1 hypothetical protein [Quatrionicoccus australiensis]